MYTPSLSTIHVASSSLFVFLSIFPVSTSLSGYVPLCPNVTPIHGSCLVRIVYVGCFLSSVLFGTSSLVIFSIQTIHSMSSRVPLVFPRTFSFLCVRLERRSGRACCVCRCIADDGDGAFPQTTTARNGRIPANLIRFIAP